MQSNEHREEFSLREKLKSLTQDPGVYQFKDSTGKVLYIGKAINLRSRVNQYFHPSRVSHPRIDRMVSQIRNVDVVVTANEVEALILEANLIKKYSPRYNVSLKDDKSYPYIVITNEPFPRVLVTRRVVRDGSHYFGPFTNASSVHTSLKYLREIFKIRSCTFDLAKESIEKKKFKVCLDYHIKKCDGPCEGLQSQSSYAEMIDQVARVLKGKTRTVIEFLEKEMQDLAASRKYEQASAIRDRINALKVYSEKQRIVGSESTDRDIIAIASRDDDAAAVLFKVRDGKVIGTRHYYLSTVEDKTESEIMESVVQNYYLEADEIPAEIFLSADVGERELVRQWLSQVRGDDVVIEVPQSGEKKKVVAMAKANAEYLLGELAVMRLKRGEHIPHAVQALQRDLRLNVPPKTIECFDISHIQGSDTVASMVVFVGGVPKKQLYKKYKIRSVDGVNDFDSMKEVIGRRYRRMLEEQQPHPDLIVVDGGKGQLSSAVGVLTELNLSAIPVIGLAKRLEEVYVPGESDPVQIPRTSSGLKMLQHIRDEAHRFAVEYHRTLRSKRTLTTELELIDGIGKQRAKKLLNVFGSVQAVKEAAETALAECVGQKATASIKKHFCNISNEGE